MILLNPSPPYLRDPWNKSEGSNPKKRNIAKNTLITRHILAFKRYMNIHPQSPLIAEKIVTARKQQFPFIAVGIADRHVSERFNPCAPSLELKIIPRENRRDRAGRIFAELARATARYVPCNMHIDACVTGNNVTVGVRVVSRTVVSSASHA